MLFPTVEFAIFFPIVLAISWALMPRQHLLEALHRRRELRLLRGRGPALLPAARRDHAGQPARRGRRSTAPRTRAPAQVDLHRGGVAFDLGVLAVFKYYGFFVTDVSDVLDIGRTGHAAAAGDDRPARRGQLLQLPGGHLRGRREAPPDRAGLAARRSDLPELLPHLVAGPIVRASEFLPSCSEPRDPSSVAVERRVRR